jgi:hypothetical protein
VEYYIISDHYMIIQLSRKEKKNIHKQNAFILDLCGAFSKACYTNTEASYQICSAFYLMDSHKLFELDYIS